MSRITLPKVSIVIPTYNESKNIDQCLVSIFNQKYPKKLLEVLVVDDNSTDNTVSLARKYPVKVLKNGHRHGEIGKMIGLRAATGKLFTYLDADIVVDPGWLKALVKPLILDSSIIGAFTAESSMSTSPPLSRYLSLDTLQRDNLYQWLSPSVESTIVSNRGDYFECNYSESKIPPAGRCLYRLRELRPLVRDFSMFLELDFLALLVKSGHTKFAYVPLARLYHHHVHSLVQLVNKRKYNLTKVYFKHVNNNLYTWVNWHDPFHLIKLGLWVVYANLFIPSLITGIIKSIRHTTWVGLYEPLVDMLVTDTLVFTYLISRNDSKH
jgi:glycosyltransferase involved in cell wall biosynthesis